MESYIDKKAVISGAVGAIGTMVGCFLFKKVVMGGGSWKKKLQQITRLRTADPRSSAIVKHRGLVYISGQVGIVFSSFLMI